MHKYCNNLPHNTDTIRLLVLAVVAAVVVVVVVVVSDVVAADAKRDFFR